MTLRQQVFQKAHRIVLKIGTTLLKESGKIVDQISALASQGKEIVLVSSGAIGAGMAQRGMKHRPQKLEELQATAALGQIQLMKRYEELFGRHGLSVSQVLLTRGDLAERRRYVNAQKTLRKLLDWKIIPIVNENDTVAVDEIKVGDNDQLSALAAHLVDADLLILLSDVEGLYPHGKVGVGFKPTPTKPVDLVERITPEILRWARPTRSQTSIGGMVTKLEAAKMAMAAGIPCLIANGFSEGILARLFKGEERGTLFMPALKEKSMGSKERWLAFTTRPKGEIAVDAGARRALMEQKKSLLATGVCRVNGHFKKGDLVRVMDLQEREFARGIVRFSSPELGKIKGLKSDQIQKLMGRNLQTEVIHRDHLVIL